MVETETHGQSVTSQVQTLPLQLIDLLRSESKLARVETAAKATDLAVKAGSLATAPNLALLAAATTTATVALDMAQVLPSWAAILAIAFALVLLIAAIASASRGRLCRVAVEVPAEAVNQLSGDLEA